MEQVTVKELATEFEMKSSVVISELKKIGVWVPSASTPVDSDIANRIRKRLQMLVDLEQEEKERKAAEKAKKAETKGKVKRSIKELGKPRKRVARKKVEKEEEEEPQSPLASSLRPRKGKRSAYRKVEAPEEEVPETPERTEVTIDDEPLIERVEAKAPAEEVEDAPVTEEAPPATAAEAEMPPAEAEKEEETPEEVGATEAAETAEEEEVEEVAEATEEEKEVAEAGAVEEPEKIAEKPAGEIAAEPVEAKKVVEEGEVKEEVESAEEKVVEKRPKTKRAIARKKRQKEREKAKAEAKPKEEPVEQKGPKEVTFPEKVTVKSFSELTGVKSGEVIQSLMSKGVMANVNQPLDQATVEFLSEKFEIIPDFVTFEEAAAREDLVEDRPEDLSVRAPVVTVMGHVDHGKTSLLDHIRQARVAEGEAGGITQHIGAYKVPIKDQSIVFIDTPGHEAFTRMRARGAQATDIVVLVVAADDGVMPQTLEAIDHARAAEVPIVVAINKIDKPGANPQRVKQELSERELVPEDWGGDTIMVEVSAIEGTNIEELLEMLLLVSEMQELVANPGRSASGVILEAKMEKGRGSVATLLVQNGTLKVGDNFIAGNTWGRVRAMFDDQGDAVSEAGPSSAVEILGLQGIPLAGDAFQVVEDQTKAREMMEFRQEKQREQELAKTAKVSLDDLYAQMQAGEVKELPIVLKADTQGSAEVLEDTLLKLSTQKVKIDLIRKGVGAITERDVLLASASNAIVIGFNVRPESSARSAAEQEEVEIRLYTVIYEIANDIEQAMVGLLEPTIREKHLGRAEVRETFRVPKVGTIAGSYVQEGTITRNSEVRLLRDNVVIYEGRVESLRRFKDDVGEVKSGYECGISIANYNDVKIGDVIEAFVKEEVAPQLS